MKQSEVFFPLVIVAHDVVVPGSCRGLIQNHPDFRSCHLHFRWTVEDVNIVAVAFLVSEEYSISHCKLKDCLHLWKTEEATSDRHQWPLIQLRLWIPLDCWIRHCSCTANSKYRWRENIPSREKSVYKGNSSGFKSFRIQGSHFRFRI